MPFVAGHFGEWLQGRLGPDGPVALVTLPCPVRGVRAERLGDGPLALEGHCPALTPARAAALLQALELPLTGRFEVMADMPPGGGASMSTAALVALARAAGAPEGRIAAACLAAEGASDPLMLPAPGAVLWAPREARVLRDMPPAPATTILGGFLGAPQETDPDDMDFPDVSDLVAAWERTHTLEGMAQIAQASARRTNELRGPQDDPSEGLCAALGALGYARAHTGSARAFIFAPGTAPAIGADILSAAGLSGVFTFDTGGAP